MYFKKTTLLARASILIKKDFTNLGQKDLIKKLSNDNYVYIACQRVSSPWDRTQALTLLSGLLPRVVFLKYIPSNFQKMTLKFHYMLNILNGSSLKTFQLKQNFSNQFFDDRSKISLLLLYLCVGGN